MDKLWALPFLLLFSLCSCKKTDRQNVVRGHELIPPLVVRTTLYDSLPPDAIRHLQLENIGGLKVKYSTGRYVSYFEYSANSDTVLNVIANLPFSKHTPLADTSCRKVPSESLQQLRSLVSIEEQTTGTSFWDANMNDVEVYECLKAPFRHVLVISKNSSRILHRIEYKG